MMPSNVSPLWAEPENIETLTKLWNEGSSASEIARVLGNGCTRAAVIGKVHRLKLQGRPTVVSKNRNNEGRHGNYGQPKVNAIVHRVKGRAGAQGHAFKLSEARKAGLGLDDGMAAVLTKKTVPFTERAEEGVDVTHLIGLMQLTEHTCKWPHGDPKEPDFGFCGAPPREGSPYCERHYRRSVSH